MLRVVYIVLVAMFISGCGVDTASSSSQTATTISPLPDTNISDTNTTTATEDTNTTQQRPDAIYDSVDALYDSNACNVNSYRVASDASYAGSNTGENGANLFTVLNEGLWIGSLHLEADATQSAKTLVTLYYHPFPDATLLGNQGTTSLQVKGVFQLLYDVAWSDESIENLDNIVYVKSTQTAIPTCYRVTLNSVLGSEAKIEKVYR
jgi:hypothetical protein